MEMKSEQLLIIKSWRVRRRGYSSRMRTMMTRKIRKQHSMINICEQIFNDRVGNINIASKILGLGFMTSDKAIQLLDFHYEEGDISMSAKVHHSHYCEHLPKIINIY